MNQRLSLLRALAEFTVPKGADAAILAIAANSRQQLLDQLQACPVESLSDEEAEALDAARLGQTAWEDACRNLLQSVEAQQDAARSRSRHTEGATGRLVNRLG